MSDYYVLVGSGEIPRALLEVPADLAAIRRWQPEAKEWINAPWSIDSIYGADRWRARPVSQEQADEIQARNPFGMVDLPEEHVASLMKDWETPEYASED